MKKPASRWLFFRSILVIHAIIMLTAVQARGAALTRDQILNEADARIEQFRKSDAELRLVGPDGKPLPAGASVRIEQTRHEFLFGCNIFKLVDRSYAVNEGYAKRFADLFNFATLGFYWWSYERQLGDVSWAQGRNDRIVRWCEEHGITPKGHPLVYNLGEQRWLPDDPAEIRKLQLDRIRRDVAHFKGKIKYWDVANEITDYDRETTRQNAPKMTAAFRALGVMTFIREAFTVTRATDPAAGLIINDYITAQRYGDNVIAKLNDANAKPLYDVVGVQSHQHNTTWTVEQTWAICERFAQYGKPVHLTEVTFTSGREGAQFNEHQADPTWVTTPEGEQRQARDVARFYTILFSHPAVEAITWWDLSDADAWMNAPSGLLRADMSPKPAYDELMKLVKGKWWTRAEARAEQGGAVRFRGFRGDYRITAQDASGKTVSGAFKLGRNAQGAIEVKLGSPASVSAAGRMFSHAR